MYKPLFTPAEFRQYAATFGTALQTWQATGTAPGLVGEIDQTLRRDWTGFKGMAVPYEFLLNAKQRDLSTATPGAGGALVGDNDVLSDVVALLRNKSVVMRLGATAYTGLVGDTSVPRQTATANVGWVSQIAPLTDSDQAFDTIPLTPKIAGARTVYTTQLVKQAPMIAGIVARDLVASIGTAIDLAAINGSGVSDEPLGIFGTTGVSTVTYGAAATYAKLLDQEQTLSDDNIDGPYAWITTPAARRKWRAAEKSSGSGKFLWTDDQTVIGYRAEATKQVPSNKSVFGKWSDVAIGSWGPAIDLILDNKTKAHQGKIVLTAHAYLDVGVLHPESFVISTDSAAQ